MQGHRRRRQCTHCMDHLRTATCHAIHVAICVLRNRNRLCVQKCIGVPNRTPCEDRILQETAQGRGHDPSVANLVLGYQSHHHPTNTTVRRKKKTTIKRRKPELSADSLVMEAISRSVVHSAQQPNLEFGRIPKLGATNPVARGVRGSTGYCGG